jgi:hypothetical protein
MRGCRLGTLTVHRRLSRYQSVTTGSTFDPKRHDTMLITVCKRCRKLLDAQQLKFTSRHKVTNGVECNLKKRKTKPVSSSGAFKFVSF